MDNKTNDQNTNDIKLARCGMDCTQCRFAVENDCPGCMQGQLFEDEQCDIYDCCEKKQYNNCGQCPDFPCDDLKAVSYDKDTGDGGARLMRLKELRDASYRSDRSITAAFTAGTGTGILLGAVIGGISGAFLPWILAGAILGCGTGFIIIFSQSKK